MVWSIQSSHRALKSSPFPLHFSGLFAIQFKALSLSSLCFSFNSYSSSSLSYLFRIIPAICSVYSNVSLFNVLCSFGSFTHSNAPLSFAITFLCFLVPLFSLRLSHRWFGAFTRLIRAIYSTAQDLIHFSIILALFMFVYALMGHRWFGGDLKDSEDGSTTRWNTDNLYWAIVCVFQVGSAHTTAPLYNHYDWVSPTEQRE